MPNFVVRFRRLKTVVMASGGSKSRLAAFLLVLWGLARVTDILWAHAGLMEVEMQPGRVISIRTRKRRGNVEIITYARGARGAKRVVGSVMVAPSDLAQELTNPDTLAKLGLDIKPISS